MQGIKPMYRQFLTETIQQLLAFGLGAIPERCQSGRPWFLADLVPGIPVFPETRRISGQQRFGFGERRRIMEKTLPSKLDFIQLFLHEMDKVLLEVDFVHLLFRFFRFFPAYAVKTAKVSGGNPTTTRQTALFRRYNGIKSNCGYGLAAVRFHMSRLPTGSFIEKSYFREKRRAYAPAR